MEQNPYAAPKVELVDQSAPRAFVDGRWNPGRLRLLAGLSLALLLGDLVLFGLSFATPLSGATAWQRYELWMGALCTLLGCFVLWRSKHFLEDRFGARGLGWPVGLSIVLAVTMELYSVLLDEHLRGELNGVLIGFMAMFVPSGIATLWYGIRLLKIGLPYPSVKALGWLNVAAGVCLLSVLLFLPGVLLEVVALLPMALMFLRGARELDGAAG